MYIQSVPTKVIAAYLLIQDTMNWTYNKNNVFNYKFSFPTELPYSVVQWVRTLPTNVLFTHSNPAGPRALYLLPFPKILGQIFLN